MSKHKGEKCGKTAHFLYSEFTKRHDSFENWRKVTTLELDPQYIKTKSCAKFQLNISKHVGEKCEKRADGDPDGRRVGRTESWTDITISSYVPSEDGCIKIKGVIVKHYSMPPRWQQSRKSYF